tara:strand:+ start:274 stop:627 length:354 start_codon:yes stop_codon:yes gene_type:complete
MRIDGRADHIEDYLLTVRTGQWFRWSDAKNKIYGNLLVLDGGSKPTEKQCTDGLAALQTAWDLENDSYKSKRRAEYPNIVDQLDLLFHAIDADSGLKVKLAGFYNAIKTIKDKYPKP